MNVPAEALFKNKIGLKQSIIIALYLFLPDFRFRPVNLCQRPQEYHQILYIPSLNLHSHIIDKVDHVSQQYFKPWR